MDAPNIKFQLIYHIVSDDKNILSVSDLCDIANVSGRLSILTSKVVRMEI